ncbi:MAG TPA: LLM class flavin-dependent oxidoreductase [Candidatus Tectomicrobia bacterium]|jgi:hypothetical protein
MQFGLFYETPEAPGRTHGERLAEMLDLIVYGESLGFDVVWLAEIHFGAPFSLLSAPLMLVPAIAARTQRIRIGTAVSLLPRHQPLSLAEHVAMADLLSGGRLEFGVGRGSIPTQFHGFGVPLAERRSPTSRHAMGASMPWSPGGTIRPGLLWLLDCPPGRLLACPLKDLGVLYAGVRTANGSRSFADFVADHDSTLVARQAVPPAGLPR